MSPILFMEEVISRVEVIKLYIDSDNIYIDIYIVKNISLLFRNHGKSLLRSTEIREELNTRDLY